MGRILLFSPRPHDDKVLDFEVFHCTTYYLLCHYMEPSSIRVLVGSERRESLTGLGDVPRLVRTLRERTGLTPEKFAAKLGETFPTISQWENGRAKPSPLALRQSEDLLPELGDEGHDLRCEYFKHQDRYSNKNLKTRYQGKIGQTAKTRVKDLIEEAEPS